MLDWTRSNYFGNDDMMMAFKLSILIHKASKILNISYSGVLQLIGGLSDALLVDSISIDNFRSFDMVLSLGEIFFLSFDWDELFQRKPVIILCGGSLPKELLLVKCHVNIFACTLIIYIFIALFRSTGSHWFSSSFLRRSGSMYLPHQLLPLFLLLLVVFIHLFLFLKIPLLFVMLGLSLVEVAIELISSRAALNIILFIIIAIIKISEELVALLSPEGILLLFLLAVY